MKIFGFGFSFEIETLLVFFLWSRVYIFYIPTAREKTLEILEFDFGLEIVAKLFTSGVGMVQVGDKVKILAYYDSSFAGQIGVVSHISEDYIYPVTVSFDNDKREIFSYTELEIIPN